MSDWNEIIQSSGLAGLALLAGLLLSIVITRLIRLRHRRSPFMVGEMELEPSKWNGPLRILFPSLALRITLPSLAFPDPLQQPLEHLTTVFIIAGVAWIASRTVAMARAMIASQHPVDVEDNLQARRVRTQVRIIARVVNAIIIVVAGGAMLMTFEQVRQFGVSLLASAGVAGIVIGFAAQKSLGSLLAGIQLAFTQPIRLDDVVIVEGEWGRIEEIGLTYVVVNVWDQRRLVVPVTYFLDNTFQNWTRTSAEILGTVYIYADYSVPVDEIRGELKRILDSTDLWDGRVWNVQVTDASERTIELRALMSSDNASESWDLRCLVRERLIAFMQQKFPDHLPRLRLEGPALAG